MAFRYRRPVDAEVLVGLQDDGFVCSAKVPNLGHTRVERLYPTDGFGLPRPVRPVGIGGSLPGELHGCGAVGVVIGDDLVAKARGHVAVGIVRQRLSIDHGGGVRAGGLGCWGKRMSPRQHC